MNDAAYAFNTFNEFLSEPLACLPLMILAEVIVTVRVGDGADDAVAKAHKQESVKNDIVHDSGVGDIHLIEPFEFRTNKVEDRKDRTIK